MMDAEFQISDSEGTIRRGDYDWFWVDWSPGMPWDPYLRVGVALLLDDRPLDGSEVERLKSEGLSLRWLINGEQKRAWSSKEFYLPGTLRAGRDRIIVAFRENFDPDTV